MMLVRRNVMLKLAFHPFHSGGVLKKVSVTGRFRRHQPGHVPFCVFVGTLLALVAPVRGVAQITWTDDNTVLSPGPGWESSWVAFVSVIDQDSQFVMWYSGGDNVNGINVRVGRATSPDGMHWTKDTLNPVMGHGSSAWDGKAAWFPKVLKIGNAYTMWFTGSDSSDVWQIGRATSMDGRVWVQDSANPVIRVGAPAQWDAALVHTGSVLFDGTIYRMWYTGMSQGYGAGSSGIGLATSADGIHWVKDTLDNPVLAAGPAGAWDESGVGKCSVVYDSSSHRYLMFYDGEGTSVSGYASSADGIHWTKYAGNPVFPIGLTGRPTPAPAPFVLLKDSTFHLWYSGSGYGNAGVGYATSPMVITGVAEQSGGPIVRNFQLEQNYPNPFNPTTRIRFTIGRVVAPSGVEGPASSNVRLTVYDILGREVAVLVNEEKAPGEYEVRWNASRCASGVYYYRLTARANTAIRKMVLVR